LVQQQCQNDGIKRESHLNLTVVLAIALVIASKQLQRRTGVVAED